MWQAPGPRKKNDLRIKKMKKSLNLEPKAKARALQEHLRPDSEAKNRSSSLEAHPPDGCRTRPLRYGPESSF